jgi:small GTP-binding protein
LTHFFGTDTTVYKIVIIGDPTVGKTSIRKRYLGKGFDGNYLATIGADFAIKMLDNSAIQIWDLAGHTIYQNVRSDFYRGSQGALIVFDITNFDSLNQVMNWAEEILRVTPKPVPLLLVGNKVDLRDETSDTIQKVDAEVFVTQLTHKTNIQTNYIETSALTGFNVNEAFTDLLNKIEENR